MRFLIENISRKKPWASALKSMEREKLYEEVWKEPVLVVASRYGVPILLGTGSCSLNDFYIIGQLVVFPSVLVVPIDSPFRTMQELIDHAKKTPVKYGHPGVASTIFLRLENLFKHLGMKMDHVPLKGDSETAAAVLGKHIAVGGMSAGTARGLIEAGKVKALFIFESPPDFGLPANTTNLTSLLRGAPFTDIEPSQLLVVNSKTPPEIIRTLEHAYEKIMKDDEYKKVVATLLLTWVLAIWMGERSRRNCLPIWKFSNRSFANQGS